MVFSKTTKVLRTSPHNTNAGTPNRPLEETYTLITTQPAERVKIPLLEIEKMGAILEDLLTKVNHNRVRSINLAMKNASRTGEQADMLPYVMQLPVTDGVVKTAYTKTPLEPVTCYL